jgi:hypothetical protein
MRGANPLYGPYQRSKQQPPALTTEDGLPWWQDHKWLNKPSINLHYVSKDEQAHQEALCFTEFASDYNNTFEEAIERAEWILRESSLTIIPGQLLHEQYQLYDRTALVAQLKILFRDAPALEDEFSDLSLLEIN